jgi:CRP-like cAMP-binding protein
MFNMSIDAQLIGPYERLVLLKAMLLSEQPPATALAALARQAIERHFRQGATVSDASVPWDRAHIVVEGRVTVGQSDRYRYSVGPREALGLLETLAHVEGVDARAEVDTLTLEIKAATLLSILEDHFVISLATIRRLSRMLLAAPSWLSRTERRSVPVATRASRTKLDLVDRIKLLQASELFAHARVTSLGELACQFEEFHAPPGAALWREGDPADWFLVLLDGRVDNLAMNDLSFSSTPGAVCGVFEALATAPRRHDAVVAMPVTGLRLSAEDFFDALEDDFLMAEDLLAALAADVLDQRAELGRASTVGSGTIEPTR